MPLVEGTSNHFVEGWRDKAQNVTQRPDGWTEGGGALRRPSPGCHPPAGSALEEYSLHRGSARAGRRPGQAKSAPKAAECHRLSASAGIRLPWELNASAGGQAMAIDRFAETVGDRSAVGVAQ